MCPLSFLWVTKGEVVFVALGLRRMSHKTGLEMLVKLKHTTAGPLKEIKTADPCWAVMKDAHRSPPVQL